MELTKDSASDARRLHGRFVALQVAVAGKVEAVITKGRLADPEAALATVWLKAWTAYPRMVEIEEATLAQGRGSPHKWEAWLCRIARRVVVDEKRRDAVRRRLIGVRAVERVEGGKGEGAGESVPVDVDAVADGRLLDVSLAGERAVQLTALRPVLRRLAEREREILRGFLLGEGDREVAQRVGVTPSVVRAERERVLGELRAVLVREGW